MAITLSATLPSGTDAQNIGANASGGQSVGSSSSELVSFHGETPTDQYAAITAVGTSVPVAACATFGLTSTQLTAIVTAVNSLIAMAQEKGLTA
jgi:hypothetical protein